MWEQGKKWQSEREREQVTLKDHIRCCKVVWCGKVTAQPHRSRKAHKPHLQPFVSMCKKAWRDFRKPQAQKNNPPGQTGFLHCYIMQSFQQGRFPTNMRLDNSTRCKSLNFGWTRNEGAGCGTWLCEEHIVDYVHRQSTAKKKKKKKNPQGALDIDAFVSKNRGSQPPWERQASTSLIMISSIASLFIISDRKLEPVTDEWWDKEAGFVV